MPPPSKMKRKILIKNKRLKPEVEKTELELYKQGQLEIGEEASEDTDAKPADPAAAAAGGADGKPADGKPAAPAHTGSTTNVHPLLSSIVNYTWPIHFGGAVSHDIFVTGGRQKKKERKKKRKRNTFFAQKLFMHLITSEPS